jgi:hypothetical protein
LLLILLEKARTILAKTIITRISKNNLVIKVPIKYNIEEIEELRVLSEKDRRHVIGEYKKGYHFLLFYGKFLAIIFMILSLEYLNGFTTRLPWLYRTIAYAALGYLFSLFINFIELNFVAKKVIRDLIKDIRRQRCFTFSLLISLEA